MNLKRFGAFSYIKRHYPESGIIVTLDADGQHSVTDAIKVTEAVALDSESLALGCRCFCGAVPKRSRFGNLVTRFVFRTVTGFTISDTQTGLRAFSAKLIPFNIWHSRGIQSKCVMKNN